MHDYVGVTAGFGLEAYEDSSLGGPSIKDNTCRGGGYKPILNLSTVLGTNMISAGADFGFDITEKALSRLNAGLSLANPFLTGSLTVSFDPRKSLIPFPYLL